MARGPAGPGEPSLIAAFLDAADLVTLTGYKRAAAQARWLETKGIPFILNSQGRPVVRRDMLETMEPDPALGHVP